MILIVDLCGFFGVWLLFTFPLYQAYLELSSQAIAFTKYADSQVELARISPLYWFIPPLKLYKEKQRALIILSQLNLSEDQLQQLLIYFDKATAWFYVSLAGLLNSLYVTYELFEKQTLIHHALGYYFLLIIVMIFISILNVAYRLSPKRMKRKINAL